MGKKPKADDLLSNILKQSAVMLWETANKVSVMSLMVNTPTKVISDGLDKAAQENAHPVETLFSVQEMDINAAKKWAENWFEPSISEKGPTPINGLTEKESLKIAEANCRNLSVAFVNVDKANFDYLSKLGWLRKLDKYAYQSITQAHDLIGYWCEKYARNIILTRNVSTRTKKKLEKMGFLKELLEKQDYKIDRNLILKAMEKTDLGEKRVKDLIKEIAEERKK